MKNYVLTFSMAGLLCAQVPNPTQRGLANPGANNNDASVPVYRVNVVARTAKAVNYRHRAGTTKVDLRGTALLPEARGEAKVEEKNGRIRVEAKFDKLQAAGRYGPEYLTYVLWAISPEGRPSNLGEVLLDGNNSKLDATTELQAFGLILTAEPYFGVTQPSDVVVMENFIRTDTLGRIEEIDAKYELLPRGVYTMNNSAQNFRPIVTDKRNPLELYEARNAVQLARVAGAEKYAGDTFAKAVALLQQAEDYGKRKQTSPAISVARGAVQSAEDARILTLRRMDDERQEQERAAALARENAAKAQAAEQARQRVLADENARQETIRRAQAEADRQAAERAKADAQALTAQAQQQKAEADSARAAAQAAQQQLAIQAQKANDAAAEADKLRAQADQMRAQADQMRLQAEADRTNLRKQLLDQFSLILETRDTARGLIVNMSDVLFDTGRYTIRQNLREKLARLSGIVLAHPGLKLEVEGHTDSVGSDALNQRLSEQRANEVRTYLISQGLSAEAITAKGFGKTTPVASNDTAAGRQQNRRVEMVVSGEVIGTSITTLHTAPAPVSNQ